MSQRVLIVDDEVEFTEMVKLVLDQIGGFEVREVHDARHAVRVAKEFQPDIILLDVMMPTLDGGDVAHDLKEEATTRNVPVLFITALVASEEVPPGGAIARGEDPRRGVGVELLELAVETIAGQVGDVIADDDLIRARRQGRLF